MSAVPKLRFPEFDGSDLPAWTTVSMKRLMSERNDQSPQSDEYPLMAFIANKGVAPKGDRYNRDFLVKDEKGKKYKKTELGDFIYSSNNLEAGSIGMNSLGPASISPVYSIFKTHSDCNDKFISELLSRPEFIAKMVRYRQGVVYGQWRIHERHFLCIEQDIPSLPEQQKIASFLSSVDKKIDLLRQKKDALELYKKGLMQKIFSQEIRFKQGDGSDFPDWEEVALNEIAKRSTEKNKDLELTLVLTNSAIQGVVIQTEYFDKSIANEANISGYYKIRKYDFVYNPRISSSAPVGPISQNLKEDGVMSPLYTIFKVEVQYQVFLSVYFKSSVWYDYMRSVANQGARHDRMNITTSDFMALPIDLPCAEERKKIADFLSALEAKIQKTSSQIEQMETFKKGLLQQMFV